jgi:hypothetical protein
MARRVDNFPDPPSQSKYPWDEWLDGSVWELIRGEDFKANIHSIRSAATTQAKRRGGKVLTRHMKARDDRPEQLYIQYQGPTEPHQRSKGHAT